MSYHHVAIWTAVLANQVIGFVWYSLLRDSWQQLVYNHLDPLQIPDLAMAASVISSAMFAYLVAWLFKVLVIDDWFRGFVIGLLIGTGFLAPNLGTHYLYMGYGPELIWIDGLREIIGAGVMGMILATWRADEAEEPAEPASNV